MKSSLVSVLNARTLRVVALFLSIAAISLGGFFISQAHATGNNITISNPVSDVYWRGAQTVNWSIASTTGLSTVSVLYSKSSSATGSAGSNIVTYQTVSTSGTAPWNISNFLDGTYYIHALDSMGETSSTTRVYIDNTPPSTTLATSSLPDSTTTWYNSTTGVPTITLTCTDNLSGCSSIHYSWASADSSVNLTGSNINGTITMPVSGVPASIATTLTPPQGDNILTYYSEDNAVDNQNTHNVEVTKTAEFKVDTVAPSISSYTLNSGTSNVYFNPTSHSTVVVLTADELVNWGTVRIISATDSSVYKTYNPSLDGQATTTVIWDGILSPVTNNTIAPDGAYNIGYTITDMAGNEVSSIVTGSNIGTVSVLSSRQIIVDTQTPTITITSPLVDTVYKSSINGGNTTNDTSAISFTSSDTNPLMYTYSIDGASTSTPIAVINNGTTANTSTISGLSDGRHTIVVTVTDGAGNTVSTTSRSFVFDNNNTLTVSNKTSDNADFSTIGTAISKAVSGDTVNVLAGSGTYNENVAINKSLTLEGPNATIDPNTGNRNPEAVIIGQITDSASNTTIKGLTISNPSWSGVTIKGIQIYSGSSVISNIDIENNIFSNINNAQAHGSYGVMVQGKEDGVTVSNNLFTNISSQGWAHALEVTPTGTNTIVPKNVVIEGNTFSSITDANGDAFAFSVDYSNSVFADASQITFSGNNLGAAVRNLDQAHELNATGNWWGSAEGPSTSATLSSVSNPHGDGAGTYGLVSYVPWCTTADCASVDTSAPIAPIADITNVPANPNNNNNPSLTVGSTVGDVVYYKYSFDGGTWSDETAVGTQITASTTLTDGSHTLNVVGRDQAGNWQSESSPTTYTWTVDTVLPTLSGVSISSNNASTTLAKALDTITLNFTSSEQVQTPDVTIDGQTASVGTATDNGDGTYSWTATYVMVSGDTQGTVPFAINYTDMAGNPGAEVTSTNDSSSVFYDSVDPTVNAGGDKDVYAVTTQNATVTDASPSSGIASIAWTKVSGPTDGVVTFSSQITANTTISANVEGTYVLQLKATDNAGNVKTDTMQFIWDTTNPYVVTSVPAGGAQNVSTADGSVTVVFNENVTGLNATKVSLVDNTTGASVAGTATISGDTITIPYTGLTANTAYRINVAPGAVKDMANNNLTTNFVSHFTTSATPDTTAPDAPIIAGANETVNANTYTITGTGVSGGGQRIIRLYNGANSVGTYVLAVGDTSWSILAPLTQNADNVFTAKATDAVGNTSAVSNSVTITEAAPEAITPTITLVGDAIPSTKIYTATEAGIRFPNGLQFGTANASSTTVNGTSVTPDSSGVVTATAQAATLGLHVYNVVVTSSTGNTANITVAYNVKADFNDTASLKVTGVDAIANDTGTVGSAASDNTYGNGWRWVYHITVPTSETQFKMKFSDFVSGANTIAGGGNIQFYTAQASANSATTTAVQITAADTYSTAITLDDDLESGTAGRQIDVIVEMKVPNGTVGGSYSGSYGVKTN